MSTQFNSQNGVSVKAYQGDAMTLLAFDLRDDLKTNCVGFTIQFVPPGSQPFYLPNRLSFNTAEAPLPGKDNKIRKSYSSLDCPIQKFRWLHVPYSSKENHVEFGLYTYHVTPRYWENNALKPLDAKLTVTVKIQLKPFVKDKMSISFTRGFMISQAYARRFGNDTTLSPDESKILFNTGGVSGAYPADSGITGNFTYQDQFTWMGWQARLKIFEFIETVTNDTTGTYSLDVLAYDFTEPDIADAFIKLGIAGKIRMILDDNELRDKQHYATKKAYLIKKDFEDQFRAAAPNATLVRGSFSRQAHCKVLILKQNGQAVKVLTGSTNFSITGLCVNANHVIVIDNTTIADTYLQVFEASLNLLSKQKGATMARLKALPLFTNNFAFNQPGLPVMKISFAPHGDDKAKEILDDVTAAIDGATGSVLFAVMQLTKVTTGSVVAKLRDMHQTKALFSYGITGLADGVNVYKPGETHAQLISTKLIASVLPEPFSTEVTTASGHRVHHKMVILDFNDANPVVYCGSSNLALGGEEQNGDNLLAIYDKDIATVFAIESLRLIDHFHFRAAVAKATDKKPLALKTDDSWLTNYFIPGKMEFTDRKYFIKN